MRENRQKQVQFELKSLVKHQSSTPTDFFSNSQSDFMLQRRWRARAPREIARDSV